MTMPTRLALVFAMVGLVTTGETGGASPPTTSAPSALTRGFTDPAGPHQASAQAEEEQAALWCTDNWVGDGWEHDFDLLYTSGAVCHYGDPNGIHFWNQPAHCGLYHHAAAICPTA